MATGNEASDLKIVKSVTMGNSGNMYKYIYHAPTKMSQIRAEMKSQGDGIVFEKGSVQYVDGNSKYTEEKRKIFEGGLKYIPDSLKDYGKGELKGSGTLFFNPGNKVYKLWEIKRNTSIIIERGYFLACDKKSEYGEGGFEVETSWNTDLRTGVDNLRDITTTVVKGKGVLVLELDFDESKLTQINVDGKVRLNDNIVVMRTSGIKKEKLSEDENELFSNYSGAMGKGYAYTGRGIIWVYSGLLDNEEFGYFDRRVIDLFRDHANKINNEDNTEEEEKGLLSGLSGLGSLSKLTDRRR